jgi:hypothetical protein
MVGPPDTKNPPIAPAAEAHHDITRNGPTSAAGVDAVSDLRLEPEVDSLSAFVPEDAPLKRPDSVPPGAATQAQPTRADIVPPDTYIVWRVDDDDRSWWSRLRSLKASWEAKRLRQSAHDEPVARDAGIPGPAARTGELTMEAIRNLEQHLASLAALRDACASIDRRLAQVEEVSRQRDHVAIDDRLHDVCLRMSDRLVRVEAAVQRTEGFVARLHRSEGIVTEWLQELSADMTARFAEAEEAIQRIERIVSSRTVEQIPTAHTTSKSDEPADGGVLARAALFLISIRQPWMARLAVPALVLVAVLAIGALIKTSRGVAPNKIAPVTTSEQVLTPVEQATNQGIRAASTTALMADAPRSTGEIGISTPQQQSPDRKSAPAASVSINGRPAGVTPVQVAHDGFERWSAAVVVPADQLTHVTAKLRATAR